MVRDTEDVRLVHGDSEMPNITLGHLAISDQGKKYVNDCLDSNRLSRGKYTAQFENDFSKLHGC